MAHAYKSCKVCSCLRSDGFRISRHGLCPQCALDRSIAYARGQAAALTHNAERLARQNDKARQRRLNG